MRKHLVVLTLLFSTLGLLAQGAQKPPDTKSKCPPCGGDMKHCYAVLPPAPKTVRHVAPRPKPQPAPLAAEVPPLPLAMPCCLEKPLQTWADSEKERADTDQQRLRQVEVPGQGTNQFRAETERMLAEAQIKKINAEAGKIDADAGLVNQQTTDDSELLPLRKKAMQADVNLTNMRAGYLKHDHLWQLLYHMTDATGFSMGMAYQNVAGINVSQSGGGASVSNSGNNSSSATGGQGGQGGQGGSSSASATGGQGGNATATGGNSSSSSSSSSSSTSKSTSSSSSNSSSSSSSSAGANASIPSPTPQ